jgi:hypothetical protein
VVVSTALLAAGAAHGAVVTYRYAGDVHGARAVAEVTYERLYSYVQAAGRVQANQYVYTFLVELVGSAGYGEMVDHANNTRFKIHFRLTNDGFVLTANPFGPGTPSSYVFKRI